MQMEDNKIRVNVMLRPSVLSELDRLASEWGTSRSEMIAILVKIHEGDRFFDMAIEMHDKHGKESFMP
ncbi:TPA: hypothetical protein ACGO9H_002083 [Streptococcus suis]